MSKLTPEILWRTKRSVTAKNNLDLVLSGVKGMGLAVAYWRPGFFFFGMDDVKIFELSGGLFPAKLVQGKGHPVFSLKVLPEGTGVRVCPCSTKKPFYRGSYRYIHSDCRLLHTGLPMEINSYLVERITFLLPEDAALKLKFRGEVPPDCIKTATGNRKESGKNG